MHPALYKLMALTFKSGLRRLFRGARSVRGAFLIIFTIGIFAMMLVPSVMVAFMHERPAAAFPSGTAELSAAWSAGHQLALRFHVGGR